MFYRLAMWSIRTGAGSSPDKINARPPRRSNAKGGGPMGLAELTSTSGWVAAAGKLESEA